MGTDHKLTKIIRGVFLLNAMIWIAFGLTGFIASEQNTLRWVYSILMIVNAIVMILLGLTVISGDKRIIMFALVYIAINITLSITDQFGAIDLVILMLNVILFVLLIQLRNIAIKGNAEV